MVGRQSERRSIARQRLPEAPKVLQEVATVEMDFPIAGLSSRAWSQLASASAPRFRLRKAEPRKAWPRACSPPKSKARSHGATASFAQRDAVVQQRLLRVWMDRKHGSKPPIGLGEIARLEGDDGEQV